MRFLSERERRLAEERFVDVTTGDAVPGTVDAVYLSRFHADRARVLPSKANKRPRLDVDNAIDRDRGPALLQHLHAQIANPHRPGDPPKASQ